MFPLDSILFPRPHPSWFRTAGIELLSRRQISLLHGFALLLPHDIFLEELMANAKSEEFMILVRSQREEKGLELLWTRSAQDSI